MSVETARGEILSILSCLINIVKVSNITTQPTKLNIHEKVKDITYMESKLK